MEYISFKGESGKGVAQLRPITWCIGLMNIVKDSIKRRTIHSSDVKIQHLVIRSYFTRI